MRFGWVILKFALALGLLVWLVNQPGTARIVWHDYAIETSVPVLIIGISSAVLILVLCYRGWRFLIDGPRFWRLRKKIRKLEQGRETLTAGLVAIAAGDAAEAGRLALAARRLLGENAATRLLQAQSAQLAGDEAVARQLFMTLAAEPDSAVLGYRGLIMAALREGNWAEAERQTEKLRRLKPETPWLNLVQFELAARRRQWRDASAALAQASALHLVDANRAKRHQAAVLLAAASAEVLHGQNEKALQTAEQAARHAPRWAPTTLMLAQRQLATGHKRAALRTVEKTWASEPHPQLAQFYKFASADGKPLDEYKHIEKLTRSNPEHPVSVFVLAEAALSADLWGEARRAFSSLIGSEHATQAVFRGLATLERRESANDQAAAQWLAKSARAHPDPRWLCSACGGSHETWQSLCDHCSAFDQLEWQIPGVSRQNPARHSIGVEGLV